MARQEEPGLYQPPPQSATDLHVAAFFDLSTDLLCLADFQGYFIRLNPAWENVLGYRREELLGTPFVDFVHPDDVRSTIDASAALADGNEVVSFENRYRHRDGTWRNLVWSARSRLDQGVIYAIARDVTEQVEAEAVVRRSEERFRTLASSCPVGIFVCDAEGRVTYVNPAWEGITGLSMSDALHGGLRAIVHPSDTGSLGVWDAARTAGRDYAARFRLLLAGAAVRWVDARATPVWGSDGEIGGYTGTLTDVTAQVQAETAIAAVRDRAIEEARLKSGFLANMSHEIRTPMNAVIGLTGLMLDGELDAEQRRYAQAVRGAGEGLLAIINDILDFSKIEAGKMRLEPTECDLRLVVDEVAELLAPKAHEKGLELISLVDPGAPELVVADAGRLRQVLLNLGGNAVKFTEQGEVRITVRPVEAAEPAASAPHGSPGAGGGICCLRFEVADTGMGIAEEAQGQLFQSFQQVDGSAARRHGGTGLGLAISKQLAEMMGGTIGLESQLGEGSTFWFTVAVPRASGPLARPVQRPDLHGLRVLVVDDNATNREILTRRLEQWGSTVEAVATGAEALGRLRSPSVAPRGADVKRGAGGPGRGAQPFDLAILDQEMPGMDGLTLAGIITSGAGRRPDPSAMRLVMLSSTAKPPDLAAQRRAGLSAHLTKPVREARLYECLAEVMGGPLAAAAAPAVPLDLRQEPDERAHAGASGEPPRLSGPAMTGPVLVAEDNPVNQLVAVRMLEKLGYRADVVANGSEAIDAICRVRYAVVLMDCQMPEMDGFEAAQVVRRQEDESRRTPIVAMTAAAMEGDRERCIEAGMDDYVSKPIRPEELQRVLARWAGRSSALADASHATSRA